MLKKNKENWIKKILIKINPEIKDQFKKKINFIDSGYLDSLMIIRLLYEVEKKNKKKINPSKLKREQFSSIEAISKLLR
jgi:acyl carrier protein